jgi:stage V sporulation protein G
MEITEVRIFPRESEDRKLKAYATITIDNAFVVRNVKVIEGNKGLFVAMPSRKLREACPKCKFKNAIRSKFCNQCGAALPQTERKDEDFKESSRQSGHRDIAHPITPECREYIQGKVLKAYEAEMKKMSSSGGYDPSKPKKESTAKGGAPTTSLEESEEMQNEDFEGDLEL